MNRSVFSVFALALSLVCNAPSATARGRSDAPERFVRGATLLEQFRELETLGRELQRCTPLVRRVVREQNLAWHRQFALLDAAILRMRRAAHQLEAANPDTAGQLTARAQEIEDQGRAVLTRLLVARGERVQQACAARHP